MKKIVCEMCGSNELIKKDGVFECQTCGTKYSVEEAKKMMVEGTVDIEGTVKIDDSNKIDNLIKNAKTLYNDGKTEEAYKLFGDVLNINTENYIAITYRGLCSAWETTVANPKIGDAVQGISRGFEIAKKNLGETKEYIDFCIEIIEHMSKITTACMNMYEKYIVKINEENKEWNRNFDHRLKLSTQYTDFDYLKRQSNQHFEIVKENLNKGFNGIYLTLVAANVVAVKVTVIKDIKAYSMDDLKAIKNYINIYIPISSKYYKKEDKEMTLAFSLIAIVDNKIKELGNIYREEYWNEHEEEKEKIESEIAKLKDELKEKEQSRNILSDKRKELDNKINTNVPSEVELNKQKVELENLKNEKASLGIFKNKEKKAIQEKIKLVEGGIEKVNRKVDEEKKELEKKYKPEIDNFNEKIKQIEIEINEITKSIEKNEFELNKDRF